MLSEESVRDTDNQRPIITYLSEVTSRTEKPLALCTIVVSLGLPSMLVQANFVLEKFLTFPAIIMGVIIMLKEFLSIVKMLIAALTIMVTWALNKMFFQTDPRRKVYTAAVPANVVCRRIISMLRERA
jgi:hypothetical protein